MTDRIQKNKKKKFCILKTTKLSPIISNLYLKFKILCGKQSKNGTVSLRSES